MRKNKHINLLQTTKGKRKNDFKTNDQRETISTVPKGHKLGERSLIIAIVAGELEIDANGNIWRNKKVLGNRGGGTKVVNTIRKRAENKLTSGYLQIRRMIDGKRLHVLAHRMVWQYFFGDIPKGLCINHKNGIKNDNRPSNLEIVTYSENMKHAYRTNLKNEYGEKNPSCKLLDREVEQIREMYETGYYTQLAIAKKYGIAHQTVSDIIRGKSRQKQKGIISTKDHRHIACGRDPITGRFIREYPQ